VNTTIKYYTGLQQAMMKQRLHSLAMCFGEFIYKGERHMRRSGELW